MSEEIENASMIVSKSMVWTFLLNVPFTFALLLTYLFCIGNVSDAVSSSTGFPFIYVFLNATGSTSGATGMTVVVLLLLVMITISTMAATPRQTFAFAHDDGLPFSKWLGYVTSSQMLSTSCNLPISGTGSSKLAYTCERHNLYLWLPNDSLPNQYG
jgi:hypothetical protein